MKKYLPILLIVAPMFVGAYCGVDNAKIVDLYQWHDGHVFVYFDKNTDCPCTQPQRLAFNVSDESTRFMQSMILMAYASGRTIRASSYVEGCSVHGNTALMDYFRVRAN